MQVIILPAGSGAARAHYRDTVENAVPLDKIRGLVDQEVADRLEQKGRSSFSVWGFVAGKDDRNAVRWRKIEDGSIALFGGDNRVKGSGTIVLKARAPRLAEALWSRDEFGQTWEYIIFLEEIRRLDVSYKSLNEAAGYSPEYFIRSFEVLDEERSAGVLMHLQRWIGGDVDLPNETEAPPTFDGSNAMQAALEKFLQTYVSIRTTTRYETNAELWGTIKTLGSEIQAIPAYRSRSYLKYSWSVGAGNWALVPWIAILDKRETQSTEQGVYCVLLFREDMSGVYLCIGEGVAALFREMPRSEAHSELTRRTESLRSKVLDLTTHGFTVGPGIDLRATGTQGKAYERATAAYKLYEAGSIPDDAAIATDITALLDAYDKALETEPRDEPTPSETSDSLSPRVWLYAPGDQASFWGEFYEGGLMGIGWDDLGPLQQYSDLEAHETAHQGVYQTEGTPRNNSKTTFDFVNKVQPGDRVFARRGVREVVGYGIVTGEYEFHDERKAMKNIRGITWLGSGKWQSPIRFPIKTLTEITSRADDVATLMDLVGWVDENRPAQTPIQRRESFSVDLAMQDLFMSRETFERALSIWRVKKNLNSSGATRSGKDVCGQAACVCSDGLQRPQPHPARSVSSILQL